MQAFVENLYRALHTASQSGLREDDETGIALTLAALQAGDAESKDIAIAALLRMLLEEVACRDTLHSFLGRYHEELVLCEGIEENEVVTHLREYYANGFKFLTADVVLQGSHADLRLKEVLRPFYD